MTLEFDKSRDFFPFRKWNQVDRFLLRLQISHLARTQDSEDTLYSISSTPTIRTLIPSETTIDSSRTSTRKWTTRPRTLSEKVPLLLSSLSSNSNLCITVTDITVPCVIIHNCSKGCFNIVHSDRQFMIAKGNGMPRCDVAWYSYPVLIVYSFEQ